jgi:hypothetical protein
MHRVCGIVGNSQGAFVKRSYQPRCSARDRCLQKWLPKEIILPVVAHADSDPYARQVIVEHFISL